MSSRPRAKKNSSVRQKKGLSLPKRCRIVAGFHSCYEALRIRPQDIREMWFKGPPRRGDLLALFKEAKKLGMKVVTPPLRSMDELCASHQGVISFVSSSPELDLEELIHRKSMQLVVLDGVVDPRNFGAIMRTAWLMGVPGILTSSARTSPVSGAVMRVACGGGEHVGVHESSHLPETIKSLKEMGFWIYGLASEAKESLWEAPFSQKVAWVVGSEEKGIRQAIRRVCDKLVSIPQVKDSASYNASVAAALVMGEYRRRNL